MAGLAKLSRSLDQVPSEKLQQVMQAFRMSEMEPQMDDEQPGE